MSTAAGNINLDIAIEQVVFHEANFEKAVTKKGHLQRLVSML
jgi:hypothetical protein